MSKESGKGNSPANWRKARTHANKRKRYRAACYGIYSRDGVAAPELGRKLRRLAKTGAIRFD